MSLGAWASVAVIATAVATGLAFLVRLWRSHRPVSLFSRRMILITQPDRCIWGLDQSGRAYMSAYFYVGNRHSGDAFARAYLRRRKQTGFPSLMDDSPYMPVAFVLPEMPAKPGKDVRRVIVLVDNRNRHYYKRVRFRFHS